MVLHLAESKQLDASAREIRKVLTMHTKQWNENQKELYQEQLKMKIADKQKTVDNVTKLLGTCKTWGGPCCSRHELILFWRKLLTK